MRMYCFMKWRTFSAGRDIPTTTSGAPPMRLAERANVLSKRARGPGCRGGSLTVRPHASATLAS